MERKRMNQVQLAAALEVSRSAVNAWINDRAYPLNAIGALESVLGVSLTDDIEVRSASNGRAPDPREEMLEAVARLRAEADRIERAATPGGGDGSSAGDGQAS
jgi:transcriptional regulator with XRE-family HTH domain